MPILTSAWSGSLDPHHVSLWSPRTENAKYVAGPNESIRQKPILPETTTGPPAGWIS
jgi:hypothetical protein